MQKYNLGWPRCLCVMRFGDETGRDSGRTSEQGPRHRQSDRGHTRSGRAGPGAEPRRQAPPSRVVLETGFGVSEHAEVVTFRDTCESLASGIDLSEV